MTRKELFAEISKIITGSCSIVNGDKKWFSIMVNGCVFPDELTELRKICYVSFVSFSVSNLCLEISCTDL